MQKFWKGAAICLAAAMMLAGSQVAFSFDTKFKYTIPTMKTQEDIDKVTAFIKSLPGIMDITVLTEENAVIVFFDNEELDDEKMQLRIPLKKEHGYPVTEYDILYQDPDQRN